MLPSNQLVVVQFECGTRILRVIHGRGARATLSHCTTTEPIPTSGIGLLGWLKTNHGPFEIIELNAKELTPR